MSATLTDYNKKVVSISFRQKQNPAKVAVFLLDFTDDFISRNSSKFRRYSKRK